MCCIGFTSKPAHSVINPRLTALREKTWQVIGFVAKKRYEKLGRIWMDLEISDPHIHLNMLDVHHKFHGSSASRPLLEQLQQMSLKDPHSKGVTLTTEDPEKTSFYEYMDYQVTSDAAVNNRLHTWSFFRPNSI